MTHFADDRTLARLAALEAVAEAADAWRQVRLSHGDRSAPSTAAMFAMFAEEEAAEQAVDAALARLRALDEPTDTPVGGDDHA